MTSLHSRNTRATLVLALAAPFITCFAHAQYTGVSHPDEVPVSTSPEGIAQPVVYEGERTTAVTTVTTTPVLTPRPSAAIPVTSPTAVYTPTPAAPVVYAQSSVPQMTPVPARSDADGKVVTAVLPQPNQLDTGTLLKARLDQDLSADRTQPGAAFTAQLTEPVLNQGRVLLPAGTVVAGRVTDAHPGRRITGGAALHLELTNLSLPDGTRYNIRGQVIDTDRFRSLKVDSEGTLIQRGHAKETLGVLGLTTGSGAAAGAVLGGVPGALIGAGVGAGISTVVLLKQERHANLPAGTQIVFSLTRPLQVR